MFIITTLKLEHFCNINIRNTIILKIFIIYYIVLLMQTNPSNDSIFMRTNDYISTPQPLFTSTFLLQSACKRLTTCIKTWTMYLSTVCAITPEFNYLPWNNKPRVVPGTHIKRNFAFVKNMLSSTVKGK